jgi:protein TonB
LHDTANTGIKPAEDIAAGQAAWVFTPRPALARQLPARRLLARSLLFSAGFHLLLLTLLAPQQLTQSGQPVVIEARLTEAPATAVAEALDRSEEDPPLPPLPLPPDPAPPPEVKADKTPPIATVAVKQPHVLPPPTPTPPPPATPPAAPSPPPVVATQAEQSSKPQSVPQAEAATLPPTKEQPLLSIPIAIDTNWYLARQVDRQPKAIGTIRPNYPEDARRAGIKGNVKLKLRIDQFGRVRDAEVVESTPSGVFDETALEAFENARFEPAIRQGVPVRYEAYIRVMFELE